MVIEISGHDENGPADVALGGRLLALDALTDRANIAHSYRLEVAHAPFLLLGLFLPDKGYFDQLDLDCLLPKLWGNRHLFDPLQALFT